MDNNSNIILTRLFDHIKSKGTCSFDNCGVDEHNNLIFSRTVTPAQNHRLMVAISRHPGLSELVRTRSAITPEDIAPFLTRPSTGSVPPGVASAVPSRTLSARAATTKSSGGVGGVKVALDQQGLLGFAEKTNQKQQDYSLVVSVGQGNSFNAGIAKAVADRAGDDYRNVSDRNPLAPGECFAYRCANNRQLAGSPLSRCQSIHNVYAPHAREQHYQQTMKNAFVNLFELADGRPLLSCFVGCGQAGGNGEELAKAIHAARIEFFNSKGVTAPSITLVGMNNAGDRQTCDDFVSQWQALNKPPALPATKTSVARVSPQRHPKSTSPVAGTNSGQVLIPNRLDIQMHPDGGMFGVARELSKKGERFALVNAANQWMTHAGGIARQFSDDLGPQFNRDTRAQPTQTGGCLTVGSYAYGTDPKLGLLGCQHIHNVVAPQKNQHNYAALFRDTFVNLLVNASKHGNARIISCFFGCAIFGGNGTALADALHAAYHDSRVQSLDRIPHLSLVGCSGSSSDQAVHDDFVTQFKQQLIYSPLPSQPKAAATAEKMVGRMKLSEDVATAKPAGAAAISDDELITCGICMESRPQIDSQKINDLLICSECSEGYQASGINLARFDALPVEFTAIHYEPLTIDRKPWPLPGHSDVSRIIVNIEASVPRRLSDGRKVEAYGKKISHYLPDNPVGRELLRLLEILHKHKLIFKLDHSATNGMFGITFSFHLKTSVLGGQTCHGYPDPKYPERALSEIIGLAHTYKLEKELDVSRLIELIEKAQS